MDVLFDDPILMIRLLRRCRRHRLEVTERNHLSFLTLLDFSNLRLQPPLEHSSVIRREIERSLFRPLQDLLARPRKEVRGRLVQLGFELAQGSGDAIDGDSEPVEDVDKYLELCAQAIEALHTGSLIIDDIEDASEWRRGGLTLHRKYGLPTALNAGNWLYFLAFEKLRQTRLPVDRKLRLFEMMQTVLLEAHTGQSLDVGTDISALPIHEIPELCRASLELKSGALMALALQMGAVLAGASGEKIEIVGQFGLAFGVSLQMFDDLGNVRVDRPTAKHLEDLALRRPSFVWWALAEEFPQELANFKLALEKLPDVSSLSDFLRRVPLIETGFSRALRYQQHCLHDMEKRLHPAEITQQKIQALAERVANAYS
ncbi:MAG: hypothetical protein C5B49_16270 [Bdellovibrio sp.]|nr:MAG: hypothetical protein C5B49_16270 [Bdellovibrio sp.]